MENPDVREKMGEGGRENVRERHDILKLSRQLEETYAEICAKES
jgi:glycosyltransferase involved in cell wall biosynthesis